MLDIIIPTYKNKEGLRRTLNSINTDLLPQITVTVIDDCSNMVYNDILEEFPFITIFYNKENIGPGMTRQYGIEMTKEPYITFIDTNDYFLSKDVLNTILNEIKERPKTVIFSWQYLINDKPSDDSNNRLHGRVYKRKFLTQYNISFCPESSRTNEDIGFNRLCRIIIKNFKLPTISFTDPVIDYTVDADSITHKNNGEFFYKQQNMGLALNSIHGIQIARKNNLSEDIILEEINTVMAGLYYAFLCTINERPEFSQEAWEGARFYYEKIFSKEKNNPGGRFLNEGYSKFIKAIYTRRSRWPLQYRSINVIRFLSDLSKYAVIPSWYLT